VWIELCDLPQGAEHAIVVSAAGQDNSSPYDPVGTLREHMVKTPAHARSWREPFPHGPSLADADGMQRSHPIRRDDSDDIWRQVKTMKVFTRAARAKEKTAGPSQSDGPLHDITMQQPRNARGRWHSSQLEDGTRCRGKAKT
jgi:hypothetical protein